MKEVLVKVGVLEDIDSKEIMVAMDPGVAGALEDQDPLDHRP